MVPKAKGQKTSTRLRVLNEIQQANTTLLNLRGIRPLEALEMLDRNLPRDIKARERWRDEARVAAVMGSCPRSMPSFRSGMRHWIRFIEIMYGEEHMVENALPPKMDDVLAWSNTFR